MYLSTHYEGSTHTQTNTHTHAHRHTSTQTHTGTHTESCDLETDTPNQTLWRGMQMKKDNALLCNTTL